MRGHAIVMTFDDRTSTAWLRRSALTALLLATAGCGKILGVTGYSVGAPGSSHGARDGAADAGQTRCLECLGRHCSAERAAFSMRARRPVRHATLEGGTRVLEAVADPAAQIALKATPERPA